MANILSDSTECATPEKRIGAELPAKEPRTGEAEEEMMLLAITTLCSCEWSMLASKEL